MPQFEGREFNYHSEPYFQFLPFLCIDSIINVPRTRAILHKNIWFTIYFPDSQATMRKSVTNMAANAFDA